MKIGLVTSEDEKEKKQEERDTDGEEGGGYDGCFKFSTKKKLEDEKEEYAEKAYDQTIGDKQEKSELEEEGQIKVKVDVQVADEKGKKEAEKESTDQRIDKNLEEFHTGEIIMISPLGQWSMGSDFENLNKPEPNVDRRGRIE